MKFSKSNFSDGQSFPFKFQLSQIQMGTEVEPGEDVQSRLYLFLLTPDMASGPMHNTQPFSLEDIFSCSPSGLSKSQEKLCVAVRDLRFVGRAQWKLIEECAGLRHRTIGIVG
jgi:hypothetical protein